MIRRPAAFARTALRHLKISLTSYRSLPFWRHQQLLSQTYAHFIMSRSISFFFFFHSKNVDWRQLSIRYTILREWMCSNGCQQSKTQRICTNTHAFITALMLCSLFLLDWTSNHMKKRNIYTKQEIRMLKQQRHNTIRMSNAKWATVKRLHLLLINCVARTENVYCKV